VVNVVSGVIGESKSRPSRVVMKQSLGSGEAGGGCSTAGDGEAEEDFGLRTGFLDFLSANMLGFEERDMVRTESLSKKDVKFQMASLEVSLILLHID
jgi:hypothetical protein